jgi:hypothetical protein
MGKRGKFFELLDVVKFALPDALTLQASATSYNLTERLAGRGFMSYGALWSRLDMLVKGLATDQFIKGEFSFYGDEWKNRSLQDAFTLLRKYFGGKGRWYPGPRQPTFVLGFWFKPSIKGFWFHDGQAHAVLINPRKGQPLTDGDVRFMARGVYELHCREDPNDPIPLIVDLGQHDGDTERKARLYTVPAHEAVPLEAFESSIREFIVALHLAGVALPPPVDVEHIIDLFKPRP